MGARTTYGDVLRGERLRVASQGRGEGRFALGYMDIVVGCGVVHDGVGALSQK